MDLEALIDGGERAHRLRGTCMCSLRGDAHRWCAICVAVSGEIELRVAEPARGWRRWRPSSGEAWLREHGFAPVIDAWSAPAPPGAAVRMCAETLASALRDGLGAPDDGELEAVLLQPGLIGNAEPVAPQAPHAEHIRHALAALAARGHGKLSIEGGRPAQSWAWVFAVGGELQISPEPLDSGRDWDVSFDAPDLTTQADRLTALLHDTPGRSPADPLFLTFMDR